MSTAFQIALFPASVAVVAFVVFLIPVFSELCKHVAHAANQLDELKSDVKPLVPNSRTVAQNVDKLTSRAHQQLDAVDKMIRIVRAWSEPAGRIVEEVDDVVEAPILKVTRIIGIVHKGLRTLLDVVAKRIHQPELKDTEGPGR
jgi:uncharacterized protein YoxC